ncbi:MAG TPA: hypothetical protein DCY93_02605, partial [Firmicutes bacterium]|nr:hypothetical protein [Bacillota bacterium]
MNKEIIKLINKHFANATGPIGNGISNYTFLCDDKYFVKTSFDNRFPLFENEKIFNLLYDKNILPKHFVLEKNLVASEKLI